MLKTSQSMLIAAALLASFGIGGSALVAATHHGTADRIVANERAAMLRIFDEILPKGRVDNDLLTDTLTIRVPSNLGAKETVVYRGRKQGEPTAVVLSTVDANGYAGPIRLLVAVLADGSLGGVRVLAHKETPGLGDKIETSKTDWVLGFNGLSLTNPGESDWKVKRDGGVFDQFTGATVTPRSIVFAVKQSLKYARDHWGDLFAPVPVSTAES